MRDATLALLLLHGTAAVVMPRSRSVVCRMPSLTPLPPALAASDGVHTFTYDSVQCATQRSNPQTSRATAGDPHATALLAGPLLTRASLLALGRRRLPLIIESVIESNAYDAPTVGALRGLAGAITSDYLHIALVAWRVRSYLLWLCYYGSTLLWRHLAWPGGRDRRRY